MPITWTTHTSPPKVSCATINHLCPWPLCLKLSGSGLVADGGWPRGSFQPPLLNSQPVHCSNQVAAAFHLWQCQYLRRPLVVGCPWLSSGYFKQGLCLTQHFSTIILAFLVVVQSLTHIRVTLCDPVDCSTPGFPVLQHLPELAQTHVHWVGDAIQPSHPLASPSPPACNLSQHQGYFRWGSSDCPPPSPTSFPGDHLCWQFICILLLWFLKIYVNPFELLEFQCLLLVVKVPTDHINTHDGEREVLK